MERILFLYFSIVVIVFWTRCTSSPDSSLADFFTFSKQFVWIFSDIVLDGLEEERPQQVSVISAHQQSKCHGHHRSVPSIEHHAFCYRWQQFPSTLHSKLCQSWDLFEFLRFSASSCGAVQVSANTRHNRRGGGRWTLWWQEASKGSRPKDGRLQLGGAEDAWVPTLATWSFITFTSTGYCLLHTGAKYDCFS